MTEFAELARASSTGASEQITHPFLCSPGGWNDQQAGVLDDIPVTLIAGDYFRHEDGDPGVWPHDGLVALPSGLAVDVPAAVLPDRTVHRFDDVHSIYFADRFGLPWEPGTDLGPGRPRGGGLRSDAPGAQRRVRRVTSQRLGCVTPAVGLGWWRSDECARHDSNVQPFDP